MSVRPDEEINLGISNFDNSIDDGLEEVLRGRKVYAQHSAWNFCGYVWYDESAFYEEVWIYGKPREILIAESLSDLLKLVNDKYGWE